MLAFLLECRHVQRGSDSIERCVGVAVIGFFALFFLKEPEGVIIEEMPDGSFAQIQVS